MFWEVNNTENSNSYGRSLADWDEDVDLERIICPIRDGHQRAGRRTTGLSVVLSHDDVADIVWVWGGDCLIQDHVLKLLRDAAFTGFDVRPVKARFKDSSRNPPVLWELRVVGWGGMASGESGVQLIEQCPACGHLVYSGCSHPERLIDISQWDGSDFFFVWPLPGFIFITDRVAKMIRDNRLSGVTLKPSTELFLRPDGTYSPGRLHYYLPETRAHELGDSLGIY